MKPYQRCDIPVSAVERAYACLIRDLSTSVFSKRSFEERGTKSVEEVEEEEQEDSEVVGEKRKRGNPNSAMGPVMNKKDQERSVLFHLNPLSMENFLWGERGKEFQTGSEYNKNSSSHSSSSVPVCASTSTTGSHAGLSSFSLSDSPTESVEGRGKEGGKEKELKESPVSWGTLGLPRPPPGAFFRGCLLAFVKKSKTGERGKEGVPAAEGRVRSETKSHPNEGGGGGGGGDDAPSDDEDGDDSSFSNNKKGRHGNAFFASLHRDRGLGSKQKRRARSLSASASVCIHTEDKKDVKVKMEEKGEMKRSPDEKVEGGQRKKEEHSPVKEEEWYEGEKVHQDPMA